MHAPLTPTEKSLLPPLLAPFFADYGAHTAFTSRTSQVEFFSRNEMLRRQSGFPFGVLDFAHHTDPYLGVSYVHTYIASTGQVVSSFANPNDLSYRHTRLQLYREILFQDILDGNHARDDATTYTTFAEWCAAVHLI